MGDETGLLPGWDVCRDGTFAGTGRLPGRDVCRDGTFAGMGCFSSRVYMRMFLTGTISPTGEFAISAA